MDTTAPMLGSTLPGMSRLVRPGETFAGTLRPGETLAGARQTLAGTRLMGTCCEGSLAGTSTLVSDDNASHSYLNQTGVKPYKHCSLQGTQLEALSVLTEVAHEETAKLFDSMSLRGFSDLVPTSENPQGFATLREAPPKDVGGARVGISLGVAIPAPVAEEFYEEEDDDDEDIEERPRERHPLEDSLLSDASALADGSLGYSFSVVSPGANNGRSRNACSLALSLPRQSCREGSPLGDSLASLSMTQSPESHHAGGEGLLDDTLDYSTSCAQVLPMQAAPLAKSDDGSVMSSTATGRSEASSASSQKVDIDERKLQAFMAAVQGAKGLGAEVQGDLLALLRNLPK